MQDVKQMRLVGQITPAAKTRTVSEKKHRDDATDDGKKSQHKRSAHDPDEEHMVDEYA